MSSDANVRSGAARRVKLPPLLGRRDEVAELAARLGLAAGGHGQVVVTVGEPGIGKTRLLEEVSRMAQGLGFVTFEGVCDHIAPTRPFGALLDALAITAGSSDAERAEIAALLAVDGVVDSSAERHTPIPPGLHYRVMSAIEALIERVAEMTPVLIAVDDVQWADASTRAALRNVARRVPGLSVVLLIAQRSGHSVPEVDAAIAEAPSPGSVLSLRLDGLDDDAVRELVAHVLADRPSEELVERVRGAAGNPLFVTEYVLSLLDDRPAAETVHTSAEFRGAVLRRLVGLPQATTELLRLAALLGSVFTPGELVAAIGRPMMELTAPLHAAMEFGVLVERGDKLGFRHALVRDAIYESHPSGVRRQLHRELGESLAGAGADVLVVAHHLRLGADAPDAEAAAWLRRAATAVAARSPGTAVELLRDALQLVGVVSPERDALTAELAMALAWAGELDEAVELSRAMLARGPDPSVAGRLRCGLLYALTWLGRAPEALQYGPSESGDDTADLDEADSVLLRAEAAVAHLFALDFASARRLASEALRDAERLGHDLARAHALTAGCWLATFGGDGQAILDMTAQLRRLATGQSGAEVQLAHPHWFPGVPLMAIDRLDEAEASLQTGMAMVENLGLAWSLPLYHAHLGARRFIVGAWDEAVAELETSLALSEERSGIALEASSAAWLAAIQIHRDDLDGAERILASARARVQETGPQLGMNLLAWAGALLLEGRGRPDAALAHLEEGWLRVIGGGLMIDSWSAVALLRLYVLAGRADDARQVLAALQEQARRFDTPCALGQALRGQGLIERDAAVLLAAVEEMRRSPRPPETAETCNDAAAALAEAGRLDEAVALWEEALGVYEALEATRDVAMVRAALRAHGVRRSRRSRHARASSGWHSLTPTEHRVVTLVAQRLTNREVADRLFISRHTVESHLKSVYRKLGITSRLELAACAAEAAAEQP